jgi:hypothetical protein
VSLKVALGEISINRMRTPRAGFSVSCDLVAINTASLRGATRSVALIAIVHERWVRSVPPRLNSLTSEATRGQATATLAPLAGPAGESATREVAVSTALPPSKMRRLPGTFFDHTTAPSGWLQWDISGCQGSWSSDRQE